MIKRIKRICTVVLILIILLNLAGCAGEVRRAGGNQEEFEYLITVGFAQGGRDSSWKNANTESFQSIFIEENGYELLMEDAGDDQQKQIEIIRSFIEADVDYILLAPVVEYGWEEILEEVKEAKIPVLLVGRLEADIDTALYECRIGSNTEKQVQEAGKWLESYLDNITGEETADKEKNGSTDTAGTEAGETTAWRDEKENSQKSPGGEADEGDDAKEPEEEKNPPCILAVVQESIGTVRQLTLAGGYQKLLEKHTDWQMEGQQTGEDDRETARQVTELFLDHYPELNVIIAETSDMALGVMDALETLPEEESGKAQTRAGEKYAQNSSAEKAVTPQNPPIIIALGAGREVLEAVRDGKIQAAFEQNPLQAPKTAEIIQKLESGIYLDKSQYVTDTYYDQTMELDEIIEEQVY